MREVCFLKGRRKTGGHACPWGFLPFCLEHRVEAVGARGEPSVVVHLLCRKKNILLLRRRPMYRRDIGLELVGELAELLLKGGDLRGLGGNGSRCDIFFGFFVRFIHL